MRRARLPRYAAGATNGSSSGSDGGAAGKALAAYDWVIGLDLFDDVGR
jgi:hypothetical protein